MNRRSGNRLEARVRVRIKGADTRGIGLEEWVKVVNLSEHGIALLTRRELPNSTHLTVSIPGRGITRPRGGRADFVSQAIVTYVLPQAGGLRFVGATLQLQQTTSTIVTGKVRGRDR